VKNAGVEFTSHYIKASDGGDGFMQAVAHYKPCISVQVISENPIGKPIQSYYLYNQETNSAYIELANASGMELLKPDERNPLLTSTFGTGLQIRDAVQKGIKNVYVGLGGSATNDGGIGIAQALGFSFLDENSKKLKAIGSSLNQIKSIDDTGVLKGLKQVKIFAINDVTNPLFGENGAAHVYAAQKGASKLMIDELDLGLKNLDKVVLDKYHLQNAKLPGSGAAGGVAYGLKTFLGAKYFSGIDFVLKLSGVNELLSKERFDYLITGEGKIDEQTLNGKLIQGVVALGVRENIPVIAVCGKLAIEKEKLKKQGFFDVFEIQDSTNDLGYNMKHAAGLLTAKTTEYFKLLKK
jgi:glycerate kinase